jgi:hypothetical protein
MAFTHSKKVYVGSFAVTVVRPVFRSESGQKGPDPIGCGSATLAEGVK